MASHDDAPDDRGQRRSKWTEPDPDAVAGKILTLGALSNPEFGRELAAFIATDDEQRDQVTAYAIRSQELVRKARRLLPALLREPAGYLPAVPGEAENARSRRLARFRIRVEREGELLHRVHAGLVARRGHLLPEPNPRSRARRRLADVCPVEFLRLLREEERADADRAAVRKAGQRQGRGVVAGQ